MQANKAEIMNLGGNHCSPVYTSTSEIIMPCQNAALNREMKLCARMNACGECSVHLLQNGSNRYSEDVHTRCKKKKDTFDH